MKDQMTYALQVTMYYIARVEIVKAIRHVPQLRNLTFERSNAIVTAGENILTRSTRPTPGFFLAYSVIL
jgi:hypothetical protein